MPTAWVAVDAGTDPVPWARLLRRAYDSAAGGGKPAAILRPMIVESWRRSEAAGVDPDTPAPLAMDVDQALHGFEEHPLRSVLSHLEQILVSVSHCAGQVVAVADASGLVLWTSGDTTVACPAKRVHLTPGAMWNEAATGTNAIGTALELDHAVQVFSAEHFKQPLHGWSSAAAPVHDPQTKRIL
jgi:transcriptional regulator of acetoin/glycerol metabolism